MSRLLRLVALATLTTGLASAQQAHRLPFGSGGHVLELTVGDAEGGARATGRTVVVAEAPAWLAFDATRAAAVVPAVAAEGAEPVARLTFAVSATAPVGEAADVVLHVVGADGAVVAEHAVRVEAEAPRELSVSPPRPNPSAGAVVVGYAVPVAGRVRVSVVDALGREVLTLADGEVEAGGYEARIAAGRLAAGVYVVRLTAAGAGGAQRTTRLTVVR